MIDEGGETIVSIGSGRNDPSSPFHSQVTRNHLESIGVHVHLRTPPLPHVDWI